MRNFIISTLCLLLVIGAWCGFYLYSEKQTASLQTQLDVIIAEYVTNEQWEDARDAIDKLALDWKSYKKAASYFLDAKPINDIDCTIQRVRYYIYEKDKSNSSGELSYLKDLYILLHQNEELTPENIF